MQIIIIIILILAILLVIFTLQNSTEITIHLFFWDISNAPLVLILLGCMVVGYLIAIIYFYPRLWKVKKEYRQLIKFNKELQELNNLNHPSKGTNKDDSDPEGIKMDDDDETISFFKD